METQTRQLLNFFILPLVLLALVVSIAVFQARPDFQLRLSFLDVGQGDAIFVQTPQGNQIVIDGGPSEKVLSELGKVMPWHDRSIDLLILTHPDADHVTGLVAILNRYQVKRVLLTGVLVDTAVDREFEKILEEKQIEKIYAHQGQRLWLDEATVFDIYSPLMLPREVISTANNTSIFGKLSFGQTQVLLTGDADSIVEDWVRPRFDLDSDILKVGHHGSKNSSALEFLREVSPEYAVIQVGQDNSYGHPTEQVLQNLAAVNAEIFRTDEQGAIHFISDGTNLKMTK